MSAAEPASDLRCSFCGKPAEEVANIVAAASACICDECIQHSVAIVFEANRKNGLRVAAVREAVR